MEIPTIADHRAMHLDITGIRNRVPSALGIPTATLLSYEYGRTSSVPEDLLERAEEIYRHEHAAAKRRITEAQRPMTEILSEWASMLNIDPADYKTMAEILGVAKSTVHRWATNEMRPRPREIAGYTRHVKTISRRIKASFKAMNEIF